MEMEEEKAWACGRLRAVCTSTTTTISEQPAAQSPTTDPPYIFTSRHTLNLWNTTHITQRITHNTSSSQRTRHATRDQLISAELVNESTLPFACDTTSTPSPPTYRQHVFLDVATCTQTGSLACAIPATTSAATAAAAAATPTATTFTIPSAVPTSRTAGVTRKPIAICCTSSCKEAATFAWIAAAALPERCLPCASAKSARRQQLWKPVCAFSQRCAVALLAEQLCRIAACLFQHTTAIPAAADGMAIRAHNPRASGPARTAAKYWITTAQQPDDAPTA